MEICFYNTYVAIEAFFRAATGVAGAVCPFALAIHAQLDASAWEMGNLPPAEL
jgi:hypothetical protein